MFFRVVLLKDEVCLGPFVHTTFLGFHRGRFKSGGPETTKHIRGGELSSVLDTERRLITWYRFHRLDWPLSVRGRPELLRFSVQHLTDTSSGTPPLTSFGASTLGVKILVFLDLRRWFTTWRCLLRFEVCGTNTEILWDSTPGLTRYRSEGLGVFDPLLLTHDEIRRFKHH